ncbi:MAG: hypothetical protein Q8J59_00130 [Methylotenera sp.]|nr:hypothetical protein [Methylotenera sp.]MDP2103119.1 hypothetical protein [Methylotenera sp.]MDP2280078.1 hypothetical protein [Methylotenera sp.]MDP3061047.1 hypothetical protein [Methylotenera sp.]
MAEINSIRLPDLAEENQVVLVADANHTDELIRKTITSELEAMHTAGVKRWPSLIEQLSLIYKCKAY